MQLLDDLNPPQREAVLTTDGPLLVLAGAGSGKTRVLTYRIAYLIHGLGVPPREVLAFTFTNKAAGEMRDRVAYLLGGKPPDLWVGTFHATGVRVLRLQGAAIGIDPGFTIYDTADQESLLKAILKDQQLGERELTPKAVRSMISRAKNELLTPVEYEKAAETFREQQVARIFAEYQVRLRKANALDFDDLIGESLRLFEERPDARDLFAERFRYVLVDEYQDTNAAQVKLIAHFASAHGNLCVVGDDDQSIYGWRGADVANILSFERLYPAAGVVRLEQNYRSTGRILAAANAVVRNNRSRKEKTLWTEREDGDLLRFVVVGDEEEEAQEVVATVTREVNRQGVSPSSVAVLYRTNAQSRALETAFRNAAIPYELVGGTAFYQRREVKDLLAYLRLLVNDLDDIAFLRVVNLPRRGIGNTTLERLALHAAREGTSLYRTLAAVEDVAEIPSGGRRRLGEFRELVEDLKGEPGERVDRVLERVLDRIGYLDHLESEDPDSAGDRTANVEELVVGARLFADRDEEGGVAAFLREVALLTDVDRMDEAAEKVRLMTIHNAKGLEFRVVCLPGLEEGLLPHASSLDTDEDLEEERRLFYVALTRGQDRVHLFSGLARQRWGGLNASMRSRFLEEIPEDLLHVEDRAVYAGRSAPRRRPRHEPEPSGPRRSLGTILHPTFGRGDVIAQDGNGPDARLTVIFPGNVRKKIVARYAQWEECHVDF